MPRKKVTRKSPAEESPEAVEIRAKAVSFLHRAARYDRDNPPGEVDPETGKVYVPPEAIKVIEMAMRMALTLDGAPARCRRETCAGGQCQLQIDIDKGECVCPGGITAAAVDNAALMLTFANALGRYYCTWMIRD